MDKVKSVGALFAFLVILTLPAHAGINNIEMLGAATKYQEVCASVDNKAEVYAHRALQKAQRSGFKISDLQNNPEILSSFNYGRGLAEGSLITYRYMLKKDLEYSCKQVYLGLISVI